MRTPARALAALAVLVSIGGAAVAATPANPPAPVVGLELSPAPGDSVRVVATYALRCDVRGCADSARVVWSLNGQAVRTVTTRALADTFRVTAPVWGDSVRVSVAVAAVRRGLVSEARTATYVVRASDAAPPAPDGVRVDTLGVLAAELDSFPVITVRDTLGRNAGTVAPGDSMPLCALARHRYTGETRILVPADAPVWADTLLARVCERARATYASQRDA